jgi:hypothetical protein
MLTTLVSRSAQLFKTWKLFETLVVGSSSAHFDRLSASPLTNSPPSKVFADDLGI